MCVCVCVCVLQITLSAEVEELIRVISTVVVGLKHTLTPVTISFVIRF